MELNDDAEAEQLEARAAWNAKLAHFPPAYAPLRELPPEASWGAWLEAFERSGFTIAAQGSSHASAWPDDMDPMGPPPPPKKPQDVTLYAMAVNPDGFVAVLESGPCGYEPDTAAAEASRPLLTFTIHHQTDLGASIRDMRRLGFGSGGTIANGDGTRLYRGHEVLRADPERLAYFLAECHHEARPTPVAQWGDVYMSLPHGLFSPTPVGAGFGGPAKEPERQRFATRLALDWANLLASLPPEVSDIVTGTGVARPPRRPNPRPYDRANCANDYWASQLKELGQNWPTAEDSAIMKTWAGAIDATKSDAETHPIFQFGHQDARVVGGSNQMHAVASAHQHHSDAETAVRLARQWTDAQDPADIQRWLAERDARGRTPAGVAFEVWMKAMPHLKPNGERAPGVFDLFLERGWLGAAGELGQIAHDLLSPSDTRWSINRTPASLHHAMAFDQVEQASQSLGGGHEWLAPLRTRDGATLDRAGALDALMDKFKKDNGPAYAYLEALALRVESRAGATPSVKPPRL